VLGLWFFEASRLRFFDLCLSPATACLDVPSSAFSLFPTRAAVSCQLLRELVIVDWICFGTAVFPLGVENSAIKGRLLTKNRGVGGSDSPTRGLECGNSSGLPVYVEFLLLLTQGLPSGKMPATCST